MIKTIGIAMLSFFGAIGLIALLDLVAARFEITVFTQIFTEPVHLALAAAFGLILAAAAFFRPTRPDAVPA